MAVMRRSRFYRVAFAAAGLYNVVWGLWSVLDPQWFFRFAGIPPSNDPAVFACLGMVLALYGLLYLEVARVPEHGWAIAAVGLTGKILGPVGMLIVVWSGAWPVKALLACVPNDFVWWIPFGLYLRDGWSAFRAAHAAV